MDADLLENVSFNEANLKGATFFGAIINNASFIDIEYDEVFLDSIRESWLNSNKINQEPAFDQEVIEKLEKNKIR